MIVSGVITAAASICLSVIMAGFLENAEVLVSDLPAEEVNSSGETELPENEKLAAAIDRTVILSEDTEIEKYEWVDREECCLRVRVQYKEKPEDNYRHKEDYFFFLNGTDGGGRPDGNEDIQVLHVDYQDKGYENIGKDRYVWDACDFDAHFEDVTFDGQKDLLVFLGYSGVHGTQIYAAYVYENGSYRYEPTFEKIPNYSVDREAQVIRGENTDSATHSSYFKFVYRDKKFEQVSAETRDKTKS